MDSVGQVEEARANIALVPVLIERRQSIIAPFVFPMTIIQAKHHSIPQGNLAWNHRRSNSTDKGTPTFLKEITLMPIGIMRKR